MRALAIRLALAGVVVSAGAVARAQGPVGASVRIGGHDMACTDFSGRTVQTYLVPGLGDAGFSEIYFRKVPVIKVDPDVMTSLPGKLQMFFFLHECGHHKLGHLVNSAETAEADADCWAIQAGRDAKLFSREDVAAFRPFIERSGASRAGHLPGPQRHALLMTCFDGE